ncbi:hypothetical protein [Nocardia sp. NBC_00416]|uniref:hypothetical protein n=1 Tax=Nocardia sp. NBC_00416 TaxID=2975991 RepID=UPI002E1E23CC
MVKIHSLDEVTATVGDVHGALAVMNENVGTTVDSMALERKPDSPLDRNMTGKLDWIRDTFAAAASAVTEQSDITVQATSYGTTVLGNTDVDGAEAVRSVAV